MAREIIEGSIAVAHTAANCSPDVIAAFPITPSTHVPEELSRIQPEHGYDFVNVESEFSSLSMIIGASAAGARTFTCTSSQGLALMHEVLHNASGMRLPLVVAMANRGLGAPLTIWNDWQDSISARDTGWIQLYAKNNQEMCDTIVQAFKIAESTRFPVMVCFDGFYLTHEMSPVEVPEKERVAKFLPKYRPKDELKAEEPKTFGAFVPPAHYQEIKESQYREMEKSIAEIEGAAKEFEKVFGRKQFALFEETNPEAKNIVITMGSLAEQTEIVVEESKGKIGLLRVKCFRPFPADELRKKLAGKKKVVVIEKDASYGYEGALATEVKACLHGMKGAPKVAGLIGGLGGRDVTVEETKKRVNEALKSGRDGWIAANRRE